MPNSPRLFLFISGLVFASSAHATQHDAALSSLSTLYEKNIGQYDTTWSFSKKAPTYSAAIAPNKISFVLHSGDSSRRSQSRMDDLAREPSLESLIPRANSASRTKPSNPTFQLRFVGGDADAETHGLNKSQTVTHRITGRDKSAWKSDIPNFRNVRVSNLYPGIDVVYHSSDGDLRFDFEVAPGADTDRIVLAFEGADNVTLAENGTLGIYIDDTVVTQGSPVVYQQLGEKRTEVSGRYRRIDEQTFSFEIGKHDASQSLVIDPTITYASYVGGSGTDAITNVVRLDDGSILVAGQTSAPDLASPGTVVAEATEVFVAKINAAGNTLDFVTYLGGSGPEDSYVLLEDVNGDIIVGGLTGSTDFPLLSAFDTEFSSGFGSGEFAEGVDGFVSKITFDGSAVIYSTYLGGNNAMPGDPAFGIEFLRNAELRSSDNAVVIVGETGAPDFPVTHNLNDRACMEDDISETGSAFAGDTYITIIGENGELVASTCLGGSERDGGRDVTVLPDTGEIAVVGVTRSPNFPTTDGVFQPSPSQSVLDFFYDGSITILSSGLTSITSSTYIGGSSFDYNETITVNSRSQLVVGGVTTSRDFPVTANAAQPQNGVEGVLPDALSQNDAYLDTYFVLMNRELTTLEASTYFGGDTSDQMFVAELDEYDRIYFAGNTETNTLPIVNALQPTRGRVVGDERTLADASSAQGYDVEAFFVSVTNGTDSISLPLNVIARGGPNGATNLMQWFDDFNNENSNVSELGPVVADTRAVAFGRDLFDASDFTRVGVVTANCNDVSRVYEIDEDYTSTLVGTFGDPSFCALGLALVDFNLDGLPDAIVHDGSTLRYYANQGEGVFTENQNLPAMPVSPISTIAAYDNGTDLLVGSYGGVDKRLAFSSGTNWIETTLGNGTKNTTGFHVPEPGRPVFFALYDDSPIDRFTSSEAFGDPDIVTPVGRTDTVSTTAVTTSIIESRVHYLYALEKTASGDTLLSCYCALSNDGAPLLLPNETLNLGAADYVSFERNNGFAAKLFTLTNSGAQFEQRVFSARDAYLAVLSPDLSRFEYSSYLGGPSYDLIGWGLTVENTGVVTVAGEYGSDTLPGLSVSTAADSVFEGNREGFVLTIDLQDVLDLDNDGVADSSDNCLTVQNIDGTDTDADGFGNACDGDFNQDGVSNFLDLAIFSNNFLLEGDLVTDMNGDGVTNFIDLALFSETFLMPPGPTGIPSP